MVTVSTEVWSVDFSHADVLPKEGYTVTRIAGMGRCDAGGMSIVFLHGAGLGDGPEGWVRLWSSLLQQLPPGTEVLIPSGPIIANHFTKGPQPGWIKFHQSKEITDWTHFVFGGIDTVASSVRDLLALEARRPGRNAVLGGFSQGGAVALWAAASAAMPQRPTAVFCLSGYMPQPHRLPSHAEMPPTLLLHGEADEVVPVISCDSLLTLFEEKGWEDIDVKRFPGLKHKVQRAELEYLCAWLRRFDAHLANDTSRNEPLILGSRL